MKLSYSITMSLTITDAKILYEALKPVYVKLQKDLEDAEHSTEQWNEIARMKLRVQGMLSQFSNVLDGD